jgi:sugar/nucleoside kinase (ribokinase family)
LWDWKISADVELMAPGELMVYGKMCGWTLARAHARTGDRIAIATYLGKNDAFEQALADFSLAYADQNQRDYQVLVDAVKNGRIKAETGV